MRRIRGMKWGVPIGSVLMTLAIGPQPYWSVHPPSFLSHLPLVAANALGLLNGMGLPVIAGVVAGAITKGSVRRNVLAGALCAVPATIVHWYLGEVAHIGDGLIGPFVLVFAGGLGAIGGLIISVIQKRRQSPEKS